MQYFAQDNPYTQEQGLNESEWFSKGVKLLDFQGQIDKANFFGALNGKSEGQELGKWKRNQETREPERDHRPGMEITFFAPKSISLLAEVYGSREGRLAHEEAVKEALSYIEKELSITRQKKDGELERVTTDNLVVGMFRHYATIETQQGKNSISFKTNLTQNKHWKYGYVSTVHVAQELTKYRTFFHIQTPEVGSSSRENNDQRALKQMAKVFGQRSFYVGSTRASHELRIYTNDKHMAAQAVGAKQDKMSVLETISRETEVTQRRAYKER